MSRRVPPTPLKGSFSGRAGVNTKARGLPNLLLEAGKRSGLFHHTSGRFAIVPVGAVRDHRLGTISPRDVLAELCRYRNGKTGLCCPDQGQMAADLGIHRRTLQRHIKRLVDCGHVFVEARTRKGDGGWTSNQYWIRFAPPASVAAATAATLGSDNVERPPGGNPVENGSALRRPAPQRLRRPSPHEQTLEQNLSEPSAAPLVEKSHEEGRILRRLGDRKPFDPLGVVVAWLTQVTGQHPGEVWGTILAWHSALQSAGFTDAEAQQVIAEAGKEARQTGQGITSVTTTITDRITQSRGAAA